MSFYNIRRNSITNVTTQLTFSYFLRKEVKRKEPAEASSYIFLFIIKHKTPNRKIIPA